MPTQEFTSGSAELLSMPIHELGLKIEGSRLEPILAEFDQELKRAGIRRLRPHYYLSTEWGVPWNSVSIAIPFYLARDDLTVLHARHNGHVEGTSRRDVLRYLRHEMGHVVNYAYSLYERQEWVHHFGSITQPYEEEYRPDPFSRRFVRHLPGWYAQKHPDEDWAETFAVWMTPGLDWRAEHADRPEALAKLRYCDRTMTALADRDPLITTEDRDEDVSNLKYTLGELYSHTATATEMPGGLDGSLRTIFEELGTWEDTTTTAPRRPAAGLLQRLEQDLPANVYRWTGHFPEHTRALLRHLARRAEELQQVYPADRELQASLAVTTLVTALAMNHVRHGSYLP